MDGLIFGGQVTATDMIARGIVTIRLRRPCLSTRSKGAHAFLLKTRCQPGIFEVIQALGQSEIILSTDCCSKSDRWILQPRLANNVSPSSMRKLTARQREVVQLLAEGKSNMEIAVVLVIRAKTPETHRANLMRKLGVAFSE